MFKIQGKAVKFSNKQFIYFYKNGKINKGRLGEKATLKTVDGKKVSVPADYWVEFNKKGQLLSYVDSNRIGG